MLLQSQKLQRQTLNDMRQIRAIGFLLLFLAVIVGVGFKGAFEPHYFQPIYPPSWPQPVYDFNKNPLNKETVDLGRRLFYDPVLSADSTISCASCHLSFSAFTHVDHALSHGIGDSIGDRNAPALMNLAWNKSFMWDGAIHHLDFQALGPIENPTEMGETILHVIQKIKRSTTYSQRFFQAFGDSIVTAEHLLKALSQFQLTFISANSKYDQVQRHEPEVAFTAQEKNGYLLFKNNCAICHAEPLFTTGEFANNGLPLDTILFDFGRYGITENKADLRKFKIPTLRNIEYSYPYMHDGRFKKLSQVIDHYTDGIDQTETLATPLKTSIQLTSNEKVDLIAFLLTLSDREFIFNPAFGFPKE